jgi:hypothetical protein
MVSASNIQAPRSSFSRFCKSRDWGYNVYMWAMLSYPPFWNKKVKIAILTLATFMAMC